MKRCDMDRTWPCINRNPAQNSKEVALNQQRWRGPCPSLSLSDSSPACDKGTSLLCPPVYEARANAMYQSYDRKGRQHVYQASRCIVSWNLIDTDNRHSYQPLSEQEPNVSCPVLSSYGRDREAEAPVAFAEDWLGLGASVGMHVKE